MTDEFADLLSEFLLTERAMRSGNPEISNDFDIYAPTPPPGPVRVLNAESILQDMERIGIRPRRDHLTEIWSAVPPPIDPGPPPSYLFSSLMPAPKFCRILLDGVAI